jgi:hypothetical protein
MLLWHAKYGVSQSGNSEAKKTIGPTHGGTPAKAYPTGCEVDFAGELRGRSERIAPGLSVRGAVLAGHDPKWRADMWGDAQRDLDCEQDRQALAKLLLARGEEVAAAIVAVSLYQHVLVDNWNGGQYEAVLEVPPEVYDVARSDFAKALDQVCSDLIGVERYRGLSICLKRDPAEPDWVGKILAALGPQRVSAERVDAAELRSGD